MLTSRLRNAVIIGPADTPYEDGTFRLVLQFEEQYPNKPPGVKFISKMFHPNVYGTGELCLDILQNRWSPTYDVAAILTSIQRYVGPFWQTTDYMLTLLSSLPACSTTPTPRLLRTWKPRTSTRTTARSTSSAFARPSKRAGRTSALYTLVSAALLSLFCFCIASSYTAFPSGSD